MEQRLGHDFSHVRIHSGPAAEQSARDVNANAFTVGNHLVFGTGKYAPRSAKGKWLLAHELTHVIQQQSSIDSGVSGGTQFILRRDTVYDSPNGGAPGVKFTVGKE